MENGFNHSSLYDTSRSSLAVDTTQEDKAKDELILKLMFLLGGSKIHTKVPEKR